MDSLAETREKETIRNLGIRTQLLERYVCAFGASLDLGDLFPGLVLVSLPSPQLTQPFMKLMRSYEQNSLSQERDYYKEYDREHNHDE